MSSDDELLLQAKRFSVVRRTRRSPDGRLHTRETVQHPGAVVILPLLDDDHVVLIRNYRVAVDRTLIELPAGTLEGEDPETTARRELIEETGYRATSIRRIHEFFVSPGILNERMYLFLATDLTPGPTALEACEEIETLIVRWDQALKMATDGTIQDAKTLVALLFYQQLRSAGAL